MSVPTTQPQMVDSCIAISALCAALKLQEYNTNDGSPVKPEDQQARISLLASCRGTTWASCEQVFIEITKYFTRFYPEHAEKALKHWKAQIGFGPNKLWPVLFPQDNVTKLQARCINQTTAADGQVILAAKKLNAVLVTDDRRCAIFAGEAGVKAVTPVSLLQLAA